MWKKYNGHNLENSYSMLKALAHLNAQGIPPSHIKVVSYPIVKIFYYEDDF